MGCNIQSLAIVDSLDGCRITLREAIAYRIRIN